MYDTAADILAEHAHLTYKYLTTFLYDLLDAIITVQTSREEADQKLGKLSARLTTKLRALMAKIQEHRASNDEVAVKKALREYEEELENFLPVAMARAWLYWLDDDFATAEREFRSSGNLFLVDQLKIFIKYSIPFSHQQLNSVRSHHYGVYMRPMFYSCEAINTKKRLHFMSHLCVKITAIF